MQSLKAYQFWWLNCYVLVDSLTISILKGFLFLLFKWPVYVSCCTIAARLTAADFMTVICCCSSPCTSDLFNAGWISALSRVRVLPVPSKRRHGVSTGSVPETVAGNRAYVKCKQSDVVWAARHTTALSICYSCTKFRSIVLLRFRIILYIARSKAVREYYTNGECRLDFYVFRNSFEKPTTDYSHRKRLSSAFTKPPTSPPGPGAAEVLLN